MYIFYSLVFFLLATSTALYFTRSRWVHLLPPSIQDFSPQLPNPLVRYTPLSQNNTDSSFENDIEAGFSSSAFDLHENVSAGDSRSGLDDDAKREISKIMKGSWLRPPCDFDEARRVYMERMLVSQGIGRDGRPRDPKFVSFS